MRRSALPLLLRLADASPGQQLLSCRGSLTELQASLLEATGHTGFAPSSISQLPPVQCGRTLFGADRAEKSLAPRRSRAAQEKLDVEGSSRKVDGDRVDRSISRVGGRRRLRARTVEEISLETLPPRARRPRSSAFAHPIGGAPAGGPNLTDSAPPPVLQGATGHLEPAAVTRGMLTSDERMAATPFLTFAVTNLASAVQTPATSNAQPAASTAAATTAAPTAHSAASDPLLEQPPPALPPRQPHWAGGGGNALKLRPPPPSSALPSRQPVEGASTTMTTRLPRGAASGAPAGAAASDGASSFRHRSDNNSVHDLLDELEKGGAAVAPPPAWQLLESLERWRKGRRDEGQQGWRRGAELAARLDRVLAPRLMGKGEYGKGMDVKFQVLLLWSLIKGGLFGDTAMALAACLEQTVRPDMPYGKDEYWASLAFYSLGLAQQAAAGGGGGGGGDRSSTAAAAAALVERSRRRLAPALLALLSRNARTINLQAVSNTFWAVGILQMQDHRHALKPLLAQAYLKVADAQPQSIANTLYGCAVLGLSDKEWAALQGPYPFLERLLSEAVQRQLAGFKPPEASCTAWAACKLGLSSTRQLLEAVANLIGRGGFEGVTSSQVWANTVYAMALVDFYDPRVFRQLSLAILGPQPSSAALLPTAPSSPTSYDFHAVPPAAAAVLRSATAQTCGNLLFGMGALRHLDERVVDALLGRLQKVVAAGRASVVDLALALRACAQMNYRSPLLDELLEAAMPAMRAQAHRLMAYNVLWSLLTLDMLAEPRHQQLVKYLVYCVNKYGTTTWKSAASGAGPSSAPSKSSSSAAAATAAEMAAYDDLTQLVQYHLESRHLGLTSPEYELTPPQGMDAVVRQIRARRQELAAQSSTVVHRNVVAMLEDMANSNTAVSPPPSSSSSSSSSSSVPATATADAAGHVVSYPRILRVESEVLVEPELVVVDVLLTLAFARPNPNPTSNVASNGKNADAHKHADPDQNPDQNPDRHLDPKSGTAADCSVYQLALEVDGPHHYMRNRPGHQDGASAYRDRVLRRRFGGPAGGGVAVIPTWVWVEKLRNDDGRRRYLAELLAATVPAPTAAAAAAGGDDNGYVDDDDGDDDDGGSITAVNASGR